MSMINGYITELEELTTKMIERVEEVSYEELAAFSDRREQLVLRMKMNQIDLTSEGKQRLRKLIKHDEIILSRMNILKQEAAQWLLKQEAIKEQKDAYGANYTVESMFIDHKK